MEDLLAWVIWEGERGAWALPRGESGLAPRAVERNPSSPPTRRPPSVGPVSPSPASPSTVSPPSVSPSTVSPSPQTARPAGARGPGAASAAVSPAFLGPSAAPVAFAASGPSTPSDPLAAGDRWARLARADQLVGRPLQEALRAAIQHPTAARRLQAVAEVLGDCMRCGLGQRRRRIVFGVGDPEASLVVIGEGPGEQEDLRGEPFVGPAGEMLDNMLSRVLGLRREQVYILNMVKCRPPGNRNPEPDELQACRPFLRAQLASIRPRFALVLGSVACKALFDRPVSAVRGQPQTIHWPQGQTTALPTFHPAYLLRKPEDKRLALEDLRRLLALMGT